MECPKFSDARDDVWMGRPVYWLKERLATGFKMRIFRADFYHGPEADLSILPILPDFPGRFGSVRPGILRFGSAEASAEASAE